MRDLPHDEVFGKTGISVEGLGIGRNGSTLLDVASLEISGPGPTLILGPNGAGKSLLLRCLHGLIVPDRGTVRLNGRLQGRRRAEDATGIPQAMVFQRPVLLRRSVAGNLDFILRRRGLGWRARRARIGSLLDEGGLGDKARQPARSLSVGEAQRLAILRALSTEPEILFLDEPTSALDPEATQQIEAMVLAASRRGTRIVMVTHDVGQARRLGYDIVLMQGGRVAEHGLASGFFTAPQTRAAQRFLSGALVL